MQQHIRNYQPIDTHGKKVRYVTAGNHKHMPFNADYLNWRTKGSGKATTGAIVQYEVIE